MVSEDSNAPETARTLYDKLGNKTQSKNVILPADVDPEADDIGMKYTTAIDFWRKIVPEAMVLYNKAKPLVVAFRGNSKKTFLQNYNSGTHTIGNPFDWKDETGTRDEQGVKSTKRFIHWMITGDNMGIATATPEYRQAIIDDIKSGKIKNSPILYYQEKGYATHATALDYLINKYDWNAQAPVTTQTVIPVSTSAQNSKMPNQFLMVPRGPQELVDYETGEVFKVGRVYNQAKLMVNNVYSLSEVQAAEIMNSDPNLVYAFDAARPQAWRVGLATGQSFGITGRTAGNTNPTDAQFEEVKPVIDQQIEVLKAMRDAGKEILFPSDGIGQNFMGYKVQNGVYVLDTNAVKSPQIFVYLSKQLLENFGYRNPNFEQVGLILEDPGQSGLDYIQEFYKTKEGAQDITDREVREYIKNCKNIG
jgi:hypothetical protein